MSFERIKNDILPAFCAKIPWGVWGALTGVETAIAYYHIVGNRNIPHVMHLYSYRSVAEFRRDIEMFCRCFIPISLQDLIEKTRNGRTLPAKSFHLTFDDGFSQLYDIVAPILVEKGVPATFFLTSACLDNKEMAIHNKLSVLVQTVKSTANIVGMNESIRILSDYGINEKELPKAILQLDYSRRNAAEEIATAMGVDFKNYLSERQPYLTTEQVRKLISMGFAIGGHSVDHPLYSALSLEEQLRQTICSMRFLRERFSLNYGAFAFPHGDRGVSNHFFHELSKHEEVDISFGTQGMLRQSFPCHFQRFGMENNSRQGEKVLARHFARGLYRRLFGPAVVNRSMQRSSGC